MATISAVAPATAGPAPRLTPRPAAVPSLTYRVDTALGTMFVTVTAAGAAGGSRGSPLEVFVQVGKAGSDAAAVTEAIGRLISLVLRLPSAVGPTARLREVADQLAGVGGTRLAEAGCARTRPLPDALATVLTEALAALESEHQASRPGGPEPPAP
jgi:ribonucleoside-diphosphate reductase alpha chain